MCKVVPVAPERSAPEMLQRRAPPASGPLSSDPPFGIELDDHVRSLVHGPDVVLRIDSYRMREHESIKALADLAYVAPILVEFKQPRILAARVNKNMSLRIRRDANAFAEV